MTKQQQSERNEYVTKLRETLKPGDTLHTVLRSVSRTGTSRVIDIYHFYVDPQTGEVQKDWLSYWIAKACGFTFQDQRGKPEGIKISGCGMDIGFSIVYDLGRTLYPNGFGVAGKLPMGHEIRPDTPECARKAVEKGAKFYGRNGNASGWDTDGGYALRQEWI
jgi:hypothetical protein